MWYAGGYGIITAALCGVSLLRMAVLNVGIFRASTRLHNDALAVLRAPMSFFDVNPAGRILNRFIGDVSTIDNTLRVSISAFATQVFNLVAVSVAIALSSPSVLALVAALGALYYVLGAAYRVGARDMRRMLSVAKSPMLSHFVEVQRGVAVIRAFGPCAAAAVIDTHIALCDDFTRATLAYWSANEFISTAFEVIGSSVILAVALSVVYQCGAGGLSAPTAGFALTYVLQLPPTLMWLVRQFCMLETDLVSVERLGEYAAVQSEDAAEMAVGRGTKVDAVEAAAQQQWGERRHHRQQHEQLQSLRCKREAASVSVSLQHVTLRYGGPGSPPALNDFNLEIPPGCKLALVGRTGAGKSTIVSALLKLHPIESGDVCIGGVSLRTLTCAEARELVSAVLQEPFFFSGTLRANLRGPATPCDLAHDHSEGEGADADVWSALRAVGAEALVRALPLGLDHAMTTGGGLSTGELALLCVARLVLRQESAAGSQAGVILFDEGTASVDAASSRTVHELLLARHETLVCICHKLEHVHGFDRVVVLEGGRCVEDGAPAVLAAEAGSRYSALLRGSGGSVAGSSNGSIAI